MDWEDCVVDVHSLKLSKAVLETMFKKCGPVRSITHWKGQGEKPHVFFEYKTPSSTDSARAIGLDRSDLQVIKISNNEMLKRKFRELAHGPLRERDQRCRPSTPSSRSATHVHFDRGSGNDDAGRGNRLPNKHTELPAHGSERDPWARWGRYDATHRHRAQTRDVQCGPSTSASIASSSSNSRERYSKHRKSVERHTGFSETLHAKPKSPELTSPVETLPGRETRPHSLHKSPAILEIPHAGEVIKFDLDTQLEEDPTGIVRILSAVKADQKFWMMTAAYYKGKHNLESAKKVLEAGIDMAIQIGEETDTKPFWHLLGQINSINKTRTSPMTSVLTPSPVTSSFASTASSSPKHIESTLTQQEYMHHLAKYPSITEILGLHTVSHEPSGVVSPAKVSPSNVPVFDDPRSNTIAAIPQKPHPLSPFEDTAFLPESRPTGPRKREVHMIRSPSPSPSGPVGPTRLQSFQSELDAMREKQNAVLEDLSFTRAAKRRAEDEIKEERFVRRKLEKHLRVVEDALARSKRMEDAALDQVKREVEARRKAEGLLADLKAKKDRVDVSSGNTGHTLFAPNASDAAVLLQLASMIRGIPSSDRTTALPFVGGEPITTSARLVGDFTTTAQSEV